MAGGGKKVFTIRGMSGRAFLKVVVNKNNSNDLHFSSCGEIKMKFHDRWGHYRMTVQDIMMNLQMKLIIIVLLIGTFITACVPLAPATPASTTTSTPIISVPPAKANTPKAPKATLFPTTTIAPTATPMTPSPTIAYRAVDWMELNVFLASDHTNWNAYDAENYTCVNFALDLVANAAKENIKAWIVAVQFDRSETGHAFVAFNTTDLGEVWIEPQSDYGYYAVSVGKPLCYTVDTSICENFGLVTKVEEPVECDGKKSTCWLPRH